jgi:uncharacterized membrane protein SirB2
MTYEALKWLHVAAVIASGTGFAARAVLRLADSPWLQARFVRVVPHLVDTVLLAAGVAMAVLASISPHEHSWLAAKIGGLLVYIVLGAAALRYGRTRRIRLLALAGALLTFAYIVGTALQRDPLWPLHAGS